MIHKYCMGELGGEDMIRQIKATMKSKSGIKIVEILDFIVKEG